MNHPDEPEFCLPGQWRRARQPHRCEACKADIVPGERYYEYTGEAPSYQAGLPYCKACAPKVWAKWIAP